MKRTRGRPRKNSPHYARGQPGRVRGIHPFEPLPPGEIDDEQRARLVGFVRDRAERSSAMGVVLQYPVPADRPALPAMPISPDLAAWLRAAADALEAGDGIRASYYLLHALRAREVDLVAQLLELAEIGQAKLRADKQRGPKRR